LRSDALPKSPITVGVRNLRSEAHGFNYISIVGDAIPLGTTIDLAESKGKVALYETIAGLQGGDGLWVSLLGVDGSHSKKKENDSTRLLRVIVVGGAPEVSISGLDQVGAELKRQSRDGVKVSAEWHTVDASGSLTTVGQYNSFDQLVNAAAERAAGRHSDVLNESQLMSLFDGFETMLKERREPAEKIFWIKGAYPIPSSIPQRFEAFISTVSASSAVARTMTGTPTKWLVLVSARMPGFSINYLKEPIYSQQIGDVIEEEDTSASRSRRLIRDTSLLATRLQIASVPATQDAGIPSLTGKLVFNSNDIFEQRGYIFAPETAVALRDHLHRVVDLWTGNVLSQERLTALASAAGKSAATLVDLLQGSDDTAYLRLTKTLPHWARKPIKDLNPKEISEAQLFLERYASGVDKILGKKDNSGCGFIYAPEELFGFEQP
jgi:hypothetical protein